VSEALPLAWATTLGHLPTNTVLVVSFADKNLLMQSFIILEYS
jgi:hypothetical protein